MVIYTTVTLEREFDPTLEISLKRFLFPKKLPTTINHLHFKKSLFWSFCFLKENTTPGILVCFVIWSFGCFGWDFGSPNNVENMQHFLGQHMQIFRFCKDSYTSIDMLNRQFPQLCKRNAWWLDDRLDVSIPSRELLSRWFLPFPVWWDVLVSWRVDFLR